MVQELEGHEREQVSAGAGGLGLVTGDVMVLSSLWRGSAHCKEECRYRKHPRSVPYFSLGSAPFRNGANIVFSMDFAERLEM